MTLMLVASKDFYSEMMTCMDYFDYTIKMPFVYFRACQLGTVCIRCMKKTSKNTVLNISLFCSTDRSNEFGMT